MAREELFFTPIPGVSGPGIPRTRNVSDAFGESEEDFETQPPAPSVGTASGVTRFGKDSVNTFNTLLTGLLVKGQQADTTPFRVAERGLERESISRASTPFQGSSGQLSPGQQAQIRGAQVGATETERDLIAAQRGEFERKIAALPATLSALSKFADSLTPDKKHVTVGNDIVEIDEAGNAQVIFTAPATADPSNALKLFSVQTDLRKEYNNRPSVKQYIEVERGFRNMETAWERLQNISETGDSDAISAARTATDQVLAIVFQKMLDPDSVVRESEFSRTTAGQAALERAESFIDQLAKGGIGVTDNLRQELVDTARMLFRVQTDAKERVDSEFLGIANDARGKGLDIDPNHITVPSTPISSSDEEQEESEPFDITKFSVDEINQMVAQEFSEGSSKEQIVGFLIDVGVSERAAQAIVNNSPVFQ